MALFRPDAISFPSASHGHRNALRDEARRLPTPRRTRYNAHFRPGERLMRWLCLLIVLLAGCSSEHERGKNAKDSPDRPRITRDEPLKDKDQVKDKEPARE